MKFNSYQKRAIGVMAFAGILVMYIETMVVPSLPVMVSDFHTDYDMLSWVITAYLISGTVSSIIFGKLADIYGKKKMFLIVSGVYALAIIFGGFANSLDVFIAIRAVQGVGMAMFPLAFSLIRDEFTPDTIAVAQGVVGGTVAGGASLGLVLGAYISQNYGWQFDYHTAIPVALALFILAARVLRESEYRANVKIDWLGTFTLITSVTLLLIALSQGQYWGWQSNAVVSLIAISIALLFIFIIVEMNAKEPLIDLKLLSSRNIFLINVISIFASSGQFFLYYTIPPLLEDPSPVGFGESIVTAGLTNLPASLLAMVTAPFAGFLTQKKGPRFTLLVGIFLQIMAFIALYFNRGDAFAITEDSTILGLSMPFAMVGIINILVRETPEDKVGVSTGMNQFFRNFGSTIAPAIAGVIEVSYQQGVILGLIPGNGSIPYIPMIQYFPSNESFSYIYIIGIIFLLITLAFTLALKNINFKAKEVN